MIKRVLLAASWALIALAPTALADGRIPGSALVYTIHRSSPASFTVLSVTNTEVTPIALGPGGTTGIRWDYVNAIEDPQQPLIPIDCFISTQFDILTPADTNCVLTACHNGGDHEGYAVITALDPDEVDLPWSHNFLVGSELVVNIFNGMYSLNAIPFSARVGRGLPTDIDGDKVLDFDDIEYEGVPDDLYGEFLASAGSSLTLLNLSGGKDFRANLKMDIFNDFERPMSASFGFECWFEEALEDLSLMFKNTFLANLPNDPYDLDIDCDSVDDYETGWFRIRGTNYSSTQETCLNPALLGSITAGPTASAINGGHLLWESHEVQLNGDLIKCGPDDPECPEDQNKPPVCNLKPDGPCEIQLGDELCLDASMSFDPDGTIDRYDWDFGNGTVKQNGTDMECVTYVNGGDYVVKLTLTDDEGKSTMCFKNVHVNAPPVCKLSVMPTTVGAVNDVYTFDASMSFDPDNQGGGGIVEYEWDFGDGTMIPFGVGMAVETHMFTAFGVYNVTVRVKDDDGRTSSADAQDCNVTIVINVEPNCDAGGPYIGQVGVPVQFDGSGSNDPNGTIDKYEWNFGDTPGMPFQVQSMLEKPQHTYTMGGEYIVTLRVTDDLGRTQVCMTKACINSEPTCDAGGPYTVEACKSFTVDGSGSFDEDGGVLSCATGPPGSFTFEWDWGDQSPKSSGEKPSHTYALAGDYVITLKVTDEEGRAKTCTTDVKVTGLGGAVLFIGSEIDEHCPVLKCSGMGRELLSWVYFNSRGAGGDPTKGKGEGILTIGLLPNAGFPLDDALNQPSAVQAFGTWAISNAPITILSLNERLLAAGEPPLVISHATTPAELMAEDLNDYRMIYVPSYEIFTGDNSGPNPGGGLTQTMINAMIAKKAEIEDFCLRQGGGLMCLTQVRDDGLPKPVVNAYGWYPLDFTTRPDPLPATTAAGFAGNLESVCAACDLVGMDKTVNPAIPCGPPTIPGNPIPIPPMPGASQTDCGAFDRNGSIGHEAWQNFFDPVGGRYGGLLPLAFLRDEGMSTTFMDEVMVIGGFPDPLP